MNDMAATIVPRSDQMNSDDLIGGPRTITVTGVSIAAGDEQPVSFRFEGDNNKPFMPCKSMRRVVVLMWGGDTKAYPGRSMTLYRDPEVTWGGMKVGGIRISHMSHIDEDTTLVLTATKKSRAPFRVKVLRETKPAAPEVPAVSLIVIKPDGSGEFRARDAAQWVAACTKAIAAMEDAPALGAWRTAMAPHFMAAEHADIAAVEHVTKLAQDRLDALADAAPGGVA